MRAISLPGSNPLPSFQRCIVVLVLAVAPAAFVHAQQSAPAMTATRPLITQTLNEARLTTLKGNTHPLARLEFDLGTASANLPMERMLLVLKRSPDQEHALHTLLDNQQDKASPNYHKWLTPEQYGKQFGPSDSDLQTITSWLQSHGFQVGTTKGRTVLEFSGTAGQVQEAFHTTIHKYIVNGEQHWANSSDPMIPTALTPAVAGVLTLHNFLKKPQIHLPEKPVAAKVISGEKGRQITFSDGSHGLGPYDFAKIYNSPAFTTYNTGTGWLIGIVGRSNILFGGADVSGFNELFGLCCTSPEIVLNGPDPGDLGGGEEAEATLDATWAGAVAPGAITQLVVSASTNTTDGVDLSEVYIIEHNGPSIMTESFGSCEATATDAAGIASLAEQAAAQGITYLVSSGDSGAEGCDNPNLETTATGPVSVNALTSTNFNVAVGGTMFNEHGQDSLYWDTTNTNNTSALSYIPEDVWNESCTACISPGIWAGGGGVSIFSTSKPAWQFGVSGIPQDNARDLPDVSLTAAGHDGYIVCLEGSCVPDSSGNLFVYLISGTSASAPSFAGIMALVDQQTNARQGQANYVLYQLAAAEDTTLHCDASNTVTPPDPGCIFNDVTTGNNAVPGEVNYGLSTAQFQAGAGYDLATGLGSVNITNLVNQWNSVTFNATTTTIAADPVTITHGSTVNLSIAVAGNDGGTPTGDVSLIAVSGYDVPAFVESFPLVNGLVTQATNLLPGSDPNPLSSHLIAHYAGDGKYAPSDSPAVLIDVTPEPSTTSISVLDANLLPFTGGPFGSFVYLRADVAGLSGFGVPTGSVTFLDGANPVLSPPQLGLNSEGNTATPNGILTFDTGTHTISASYSGDLSFNPSVSGQSQSFTITPGFFATIPSAISTVLISAQGGSGATSLSVANSTGFSGTISLTCSGLPSEAACAFSPSSITANGTALTTNVSITVTTEAPTALAHSQQKTSWLLSEWIFGVGLVFSSVLVCGKKQRARGLFLLLTLALVVLAPGCGGGGNPASKAPPPDLGTPTGVSTVLVNATSGSIVSTSAFILVVQ